MNNFTLEELKILKEKLSEEIENKESQSKSSKHAGGRPKKNTVFKKTEIRMEPELYDNLCILAALDRRSVNAYLCMLVENAVNLPQNRELIQKYLENE